MLSEMLRANLAHKQEFTRLFFHLARSADCFGCFVASWNRKESDRFVCLLRGAAFSWKFFLLLLFFSLSSA